MLNFLPPLIVGSLTFTLLVLNTLVLGLIFHVVALFKLIVPVPAWRRACVRLLLWMIPIWVDINDGIYRLTNKTRWDVSGLEGLNQESYYLIVCNHQSWIDILALLKIFNRRVPFPRFFLKQELIWMPIVGTACWALDFPFMKRYSREFLEKHPELRGKDLETTRKATEKFKHMPVSVLNFLEGTRLTPKKHARQKSPYKHLLRPKAGGVAFVLAAMGQRFNALLDVTIIYPDNLTTFWHFLSGRMSRIIVRVEKMDIPAEFLEGDYMNDPHFRHRFQAWVRDLWDKKDSLIEQTLQEVQERV